MSNDVSVTIDVANQSITSSDTNIITVPTQNFEIVTFDNKPCIRATANDYATFTINPAVKGFSCDVFLQVVNGFTLLIEFHTILNTQYSLVYYPYGKWTNPDNLVFDHNNVLIGVWVTVTYSSTNKTITFDNGTNQLVRTVDSNIIDLSIGSYNGRYNIYLTNLGAETSIRYVNKFGIVEVWANIKNYITAQLLGKSNTGHTHVKSEITDFPTIPTKTSDLTNDSGFLTSADLLPIGSYIQFAGSQAPEGFLVCNGGEISRTTYSALFAVIGTTYGSGDGSTTFNLPNLTDRFLQGSTSVGTVKNAGLPNITGDNHALYWNGTADENKVTGAFYSIMDRANLGVEYYSSKFGQCDVKFDASRSNSIYGKSSTVQPPALTCLICIKY